jgi:hypothetical protein
MSEPVKVRTSSQDLQADADSRSLAFWMAFTN